MPICEMTPEKEVSSFLAQSLQEASSQVHKPNRWISSLDEIVHLVNWGFCDSKGFFEDHYKEVQARFC